MVDKRGPNASDMALDFQSYLLSASPPDFEFPSVTFLKRRRSSPQIDVGGLELPRPGDKPSQASSELWRLQELLLAEENLSIHEEVEGFGLTKCTNRSNDADRVKSWQSAYNCANDSCSCPVKESSKKVRRKVVFADDAGRELTEVLIIPETSDEPPVLRLDCMSISRNVAIENKANVKETVSLAINFPQPAADYLEFYNKVSRCCVSLENIIVRDSLVLVGSIKIKNSASDKRVFVRITYDGWSSNHDVAASFAAPFGQFETYSFEITVPSDINSSIADRIQFAVCLCADGHEYWDNNGGHNYKVTVETKYLHADCDSVDGAKPINGYRNGYLDRASAFTFDHSPPSFPSYSGYNSVDPGSPYW